MASCAPRGKKAPGGPADLVVYSSHPEELVRVVVAEYRDRTGLAVSYVHGGTTEMLARLRAESGSGPGPGGCDVFWGGGAESLCANADLFQPRKSREDGAIPEAYKARDATWTGFTILPMVIGYNSRLLKPTEVPRAWADLLAPRFKGAIAFADPEVSASSYTILRTIEEALGARDAEGRLRVEKSFVAALDGRMLASSAAVFPAVASGEYLVGLYHDEAALELQRSGSDLRVVYPRDGTSAVVDGVAVVRGSPRAEAAGAFMDYVLSLDVAKVMAVRFHRRSVRLDAPSPEGQPGLASLRVLPYDVDAAAKDKAETLRRFSALRAGYR